MQSIKDILKVSASNVVKLLAGLLVAFVLPKIIGVADTTRPLPSMPLMWGYFIWVFAMEFI